MRNEKTRRIVITALLVAICLLLGLTPIGYISIGVIEITLLCIPVIIGTITEGLGVGLILGFFLRIDQLSADLYQTYAVQPVYVFTQRMENDRDHISSPGCLYR